MRSIQEVVHDEGLGGSPVSLRRLAQKYGVTSLAAMIVAHDRARLSARSRTFHQDIVTPSGTPLGGWIDLEIHGNGDYKIMFHIHSSSVLGDFDFDLRAYLTAPGCPVFFFHHSGHVSGVDDSDFSETGNLPLLALYAAEFLSGGMYSVAKDFSWGGIVGTLDRLANDLVNLRILDFGADVAGLAIGVVIGATREAVGWLNANLGPGVTIGIVSGMAVFAAASALGASSAAALQVGSTAGVALGALTTALISTRSLQQTEIDEARKVFADTIPYDKVTLTDLGSLGGRAFTAPGVDGRIYVNLGSAFQNPLGSHPSAYPGAGELLIHELTHAWQIANGRFLPGFVCSGIVNQVDYQFGDNVYKYGPAGPGWSALNLEQQGAIVNGWYAGNNDSNDSNTLQNGYGPMDTATNPYYMYIRDNILARNAG